MEENKAQMPASEAKKEREFIDDMPHKFKRQIGKSIATGLTGFVAGAIVSAVILYPWLYTLGKLCPTDVLSPPPLTAPAQPASEPQP